MGNTRWCVMLLLAVAPTAWGDNAGPQARQTILGKDRIFYIYGGTPEDMGGVNLVQCRAEEWKGWAEKGVVAGRAQTWFKILRNPVDKGVDGGEARGFPP